jgi:hypothetical protein
LQAPQLATESLVSIQLWPHCMMLPLVAQAQAPSVQVPAAPQSVQPVPQCRGSLLVSAHVPSPHCLRSAGQVHDPP